MDNSLLKNQKKFPNATIPNVITFGGLIFALTGIYLLLNDQILIAIIFLTLSDVWDTLDGYIARKFKMFSPIGADLDSLVDAIAYMIPPFIIAVLSGSNILIFTAGIFVACGIFRLAKFNVEEKIIGYGKGMQTPIAAHFIYLSVVMGMPYEILPLAYLGLSILMISPFLIKSKFSTGTSLILMPMIIFLVIFQ